MSPSDKLIESVHDGRTRGKQEEQFISISIYFYGSLNRLTMIEKLKQTKIEQHLIKAITQNLSSKDTVVELNCSNTYFGEILKQAGVKFIGLNAEEKIIDSLKNAAPALAKFLKVGSDAPKAAKLFFSFLNHDWKGIPQGASIVVVSHGEKDYDSICLALAPYVSDGAATIQFGEFFLTVGERK